MMRLGSCAGVPMLTMNEPFSPPEPPVLLPPKRSALSTVIS